MNKTDYEKLFTMSQREVAKAMGMSHTQVFETEKRALQKVKQALADRNIDLKLLLEEERK